MKKLHLLVFIFFIFSMASYAQNTAVADTGLVKWLSFKEAFDLNKKQSKPFLIDIYTDWCGWCKYMIKTTYSQPQLAEYINTNFYPVKFNAETKDTVEYLGIKYMNPGNNKKSTHQLAIKLLGQNISYPSTIFSNNNFKFNLLSAGYLDIKKMEPLLVYTLENIFRTTAYEDFQKCYDRAYLETAQTDTVKSPLKWYTINEALQLNKKKPKKLLIDIYTNWCNGCMVMNKATFPNPKIASYLSKNFYAVDFNAESRDTIVFGNQTYINTGANGNPFHPFILALLKGNMTLPTNVILNENLEMLDALALFLTPETLDPILHYYGEDSYKTTKWPDYQKKLEESKKEKAKK